MTCIEFSKYVPINGLSYRISDQRRKYELPIKTFGAETRVFGDKFIHVIALHKLATFVGLAIVLLLRSFFIWEIFPGDAWDLLLIEKIVLGLSQQSLWIIMHIHMHLYIMLYPWKL